MGRSKGKGKKQTVVTDQSNVGNAKEEKIPASKRRGRPNRPSKDEVEDEEIEKITENGDESGKSSITRKGLKVEEVVVIESGTKRKRSSQVKQNSDSIKEETGSKVMSNNDESSVKSLGFRQNGSRRKNKPHRAAEVGVECN